MLTDDDSLTIAATVEAAILHDELTEWQSKKTY